MLADELGFEAELQRSARTISSAIRYFLRAPEVSVRFGEGEFGNRYLQEGWAESAAGGVISEGFDGLIKLPRPVAHDDFVLSLELGPIMAPSTGLDHRITVATNGETLLAADITCREIRHCLLPRQTIEAADETSIRIFFPDARNYASPAQPLDDRLLSIVLYSLTLTPASIFAVQRFPARVAITDAIRKLVYRESDKYRLHRLDRTVEASALKSLQTQHGTIVFLHAASGELRHTAPSVAPRNVFVALSGRGGSILHVALDGEHLVIQFLGQLNSEHGGLQPARYSDEFKIVEVTKGSQSEFGLQADGLFLCAEGDGRITLSRRSLGPWERFRLDEPRAVGQSENN